MTDSHTYDKKTLRKSFAAMRNGLDPGDRARWSTIACDHAAKLMEQQSWSSVMVYIPFRSELDVRPFIEWCWSHGKKVIVPRCVAADKSMTLHVITHWNQLTAGAYGILEPDPQRTAAWEKGKTLNLVIVPGLAFDRQGGRMGYGAGYYDRFAAGVSASNDEGKRSAVWMGICYEAQLVPQVPLEPHDLRLNGVITESGVFTRI